MMRHQDQAIVEPKVRSRSLFPGTRGYMEGQLTCSLVVLPTLLPSLLTKDGMSLDLSSLCFIA
jgi:hypothetical protein